MIGTSLTHYILEEKIGEGGMGVVYKAEDTRLKRPVALKFLPQELTNDSEARQRFIQEARAASSLQHNNICTIHEIDETKDGQYYICMDYYGGETLKSKIEDGRLTIEEALDTTIQISQGLDKAHSAGIIHRDIKPANIMITDGTVKIVDFGLAKLARQTRLTKTSSTMGTAAYMSPEQSRGKEVDHRTDIFSLGVLLYEMLTGQLPFKGDCVQVMIYSIVNEEPESLMGLRAGVPMELERIVNKTLAKNPDERYQHTSEMLTDLEILLKQLELNKPQDSPFRLQKSNKGHVTIGVFFTFIIVLLAVYLFLRSDEGIDSIAVLPLKNLSVDPEQEYFSDGMTEALITELSRIKALRVISRTSAMSYKNKDKSVQEIAGELNVDAIVEGSALLVDERVRINAQLINAKTDEHLWAEEYERSFQDILLLQKEVARAIASEIRIVMTPDEETQLNRIQQINPEAKKAYLKGLHFIYRWTEADVKKGIYFFKETINRDSLYAPAYVGLSIGYLNLMYHSWMSPNEGLLLMEMAAKKAIEIDDTLAEAYGILGIVKYIHHWDWKGAELQFKQSLAHNSGSANVHLFYGWFLSLMKRHEEAIEELNLAKELDPLSIRIWESASWIYLYARQYDKAMEHANEIINLEFHNPLGHTIQGIVYTYKAMYIEAIQSFQKATKLGGGSYCLPALARVYALSGEHKKARELLNQIKDIDVYLVDIAQIYLALDDKEKVFKTLERAFQLRSAFIVWLKVDPFWDSIRTEPRFKELIIKIGFEP